MISRDSKSPVTITDHKNGEWTVQYGSGAKMSYTITLSALRAEIANTSMCIRLMRRASKQLQTQHNIARLILMAMRKAGDERDTRRIIWLAQIAADIKRHITSLFRAMRCLKQHVGEMIGLRRLVTAKVSPVSCASFSVMVSSLTGIEIDDHNVILDRMATLVGGIASRVAPFSVPALPAPVAFSLDSPE